MLTGNNAAQFSIGSTTYGSSLAAGASCTIPVTCAMTAYGSYDASLTLTSNATPATQSVPLTCSVNGTVSAILTPAINDFGKITVGTSTPATTFRLSNTGNISLSISSVALTGNNPSSFSITANRCGNSLAASASCNVSVVFSPATTGAFTADINVVDGEGMQTSAFTATAISTVPSDFTTSASPATQATYRRTTVTYTINLQAITADNPFTGAVALSASGPPEGASAALFPHERQDRPLHVKGPNTLVSSMAFAS